MTGSGAGLALVTGASGFVGGHLAEALVAGGDFVRGQRGRVPARLHQFAERLGVGIDVLE